MVNADESSRHPDKDEGSGTENTNITFLGAKDISSCRRVTLRCQEKKSDISGNETPTRIDQHSLARYVVHEEQCDKTHWFKLFFKVGNRHLETLYSWGHRRWELEEKGDEYEKLTRGGDDRSRLPFAILFVIIHISLRLQFDDSSAYAARRTIPRHYGSCDFCAVFCGLST
ncbi:hypothetical protein BDN70DRAFT_900266 [Pholiota conissans]|uniref:Uncharacterized protein n=1 Tax=Pholiota conissans TaxID=109636 RepID=A0A9P5YSC3_9AGAR|nr:hypothetical protein BDN70DRAFT_900266 [Pholiota conissans]